MAARTVLWAAGVAASPVARALGASLDRMGRVRAEPTLAVPGHSEIFVAGDICALEQVGVPLPGVVQVAKQQGAHAARNVVRAVRGVPLEPFRYRDYGNMATIGRGSASRTSVRSSSPASSPGFSGFSCTFSGSSDSATRIAVLGEWAWSYVTLQRRVRLITGDDRSI